MLKSPYLVLSAVSLCVAMACADVLAQTAPAAAAPKTVAEEARALINDLRNYSVHTYASDVWKKIPPALDFLAAHKGDVSNKVVLSEVKMTVLKTAARARDLDVAQPLARELLETDGIHVAWKIDAAEYLANGILRKDDFNGADALYAPFLEMKQAGLNDLVHTYALRADLYTRRNDMAGALAVIADAQKTRTENEGWYKIFSSYLDTEAYKIYKTFYRYEEAYAYCLSKGRKSMALELVSGGLIADLPRGEKLAKEMLADKNLALGERLAAWDWLFTRDHALTDQYFTEMLGATTRETNNVISKLQSKLFGTSIHNVYDAGHPAYFGNWEETVRVWESYAKILAMIGGAPEFRSAQYGMTAYAEAGNLKKAAEVAAYGLSNASLKPEERYEFALASQALTLTGKPEKIAKAIGKIDNELGADLPAAERIKRLDRVGSAAVASGNEELARGFSLYRDTVKPDLPKKRYVAHYSPRRVAGAGDWVNLPFKPEEQAFERKYGGGDLSFMTTDVATGDRGNAVKGGHSDHPTTLQVVTDDWGIHILMSFYDSRAREFEAGALDAGSYECYIAPGDNQPYSCFLCYPRTDASVYMYNTSYNSPGHRRILDADPSKVKSETLFTDDCVINYVAFSWDNYATLIPTDKTVWDLECVFWGPVASAWNGTESIHGRSTWGELCFDLPTAARVKICRAQIFKAANTYKAEKGPNPTVRNSVQGGIFDFWQDEELGDPEFYASVLKPLEEKLDKGLEKVKVGMSDEDVRDVAENYLQQWRDIRFTVSRLRSAYLKERFSE